ncbi:hypothetical protein [Janthinobacterium agaricidamnosum]|uniref:hypothetical protein n=1 Tax=Janthinobacterium agaricidamnosum TaxID=55508 RepID=UPI000A6F6977|nr:hypothetical protein [Janthinobacterium agaricidamnosum]
MSEICQATMVPQVEFAAAEPSQGTDIEFLLYETENYCTRMSFGFLIESRWLSKKVDI